MSLKRKKGSSLIAVLLIFAVLSISSLSILSLTVSDYNVRITASKKVQSLYASDSGVNAVYGIMKKISSQATQIGNNAVDDYMKTFDGSLDTSELKTKLNDIFKQSYQQSISTYISSNIASPHEYLNDGTCKDLEGNTMSLYDSATTNQPTIAVEENLDESYPIKANQWKFKIVSQFFTSPINDQTSNKRIVTADIVLPNNGYQGSYLVNPIEQETSINPVWKNAISIDGDMNINSDITVNGDIFVKGKMPVVATEKVYTKYNGGITIGSENDATAIMANFNKNVVTSNSFNINGQNKTVNVAGNIYAGNVYVGKNNNSDQSDSSNCWLTVHDPGGIKGMVYTDNDLSLYATNSHINIDKYYGINGIDENEEKRAVDKDYNSSSSIIVNTDDIGTNSFIKIGDAIINGTAFINTETPYETGESVSIKGNYRAYTVPIPKSTGTPYDEDKVDFVYNKPLQLVNNFKSPNTNLEYKDKAKYFREIDNLQAISLKKDGITIGNLIFSAGVAVANGGLKPEATDTSLIQSKRDDFAKMVYEMGDDKHLGVPTNDDTSTMLKDDYSQGKIYKDVFAGDEVAKRDVDGYQTNTIAQVNLSKVDDCENIDINNSEVEVRTKSKNVVLLGEGSTYIPTANDEVIDLSKMGDPHGIIITSGNVTLSGKVTFTGTIIAGGDLTTINDGQKILTYDDNYMLKTIARDYTNTYGKIFNPNTTISTQNVTVATTVGENSNGTKDDTVLPVTLSNWRVNN